MKKDGPFVTTSLIGLFVLRGDRLKCVKTGHKESVKADDFGFSSFGRVSIHQVGRLNRTGTQHGDQYKMWLKNRKQKTENRKPTKMSFLICIQVWKTKGFHFPRKLWKTEATKRIFPFFHFKMWLKNRKQKTKNRKPTKIFGKQKVFIFLENFGKLKQPNAFSIFLGKLF
ncbi:hypothetical protein LXL04_026279 [Taraxacum kok-saghyz]